MNAKDHGPRDAEYYSDTDAIDSVVQFDDHITPATTATGIRHTESAPPTSELNNVYWQTTNHNGETSLPLSGFRSRASLIWYQVTTSETWRMFTLTVGFAGLQFLWTVEMGYGSPYLLSLGLKKSLTSLVWLAGPLSGLVTQPLIGALSDRCRSRYGRRRPFIIGASVVAVWCLATIGWTKEFVQLFLPDDAPGAGAAVIWLAIGAFYLIDFAINSIQACLRALVVDILPVSQQERGTAWASRMIGLGNICGYLMGYADLTKWFPMLGNTQLKVLVTLASGVLLLTMWITCYYTTETPISAPRQARNIQKHDVMSKSPFGTLKQVFTTMKKIPQSIRDVCNVQFLSWIGWFPFLFYNTIYVADIYTTQHGLPSSPSQSPTEGGENENLLGVATREGSFAMLLYALTSFGCSMLLPIFLRRRLIPALSTLPRLWTMSLCIYGLTMFATFFVSTVGMATTLISLCGFSWAVTIWAPFSIIGEQLNQYMATSSGGQIYRESSGEMGETFAMSTFAEGSDTEADADTPSPHASVARPAVGEQQAGPNLSAGIVLGIHNVYVTFPQFITAFLCSVIFAFFERSTEFPGEEGSVGQPDSGNNHAEAIGWVLRIGGIASLAAAYLSLRIK
ncbi:hypothetical protein EV182_000505 [Spiromyces aspiralis]|uniref:Uncharacterized protein n=1 Tax=Spiromyces aspiralis TaxID=68401 RepID=A0ACC1HHI5_9FUNG|nr:hypothetical protein EV182_000505 [Spiromyces aspiralis]